MKQTTLIKAKITATRQELNECGLVDRFGINPGEQVLVKKPEVNNPAFYYLQVGSVFLTINSNLITLI